jgi:hypothetical protein
MRVPLARCAHRRIDVRYACLHAVWPEKEVVADFWREALPTRGRHPRNVSGWVFPYANEVLARH